MPPRFTSAAPESGFERSCHRARKPSHDGSRALHSLGSQAAQRAPLFSGRGRPRRASCGLPAMPTDSDRHAQRQRSVAGRVWRRTGFASRPGSRAGRGDNRRRIEGRLVLGLAAVLLIGAIGAPFVVGGRTESTPSRSVIAELPTVAPTASLAPSFAIAWPSPSTSPLSPSPSGSAAFVAAAYTYGQRPPRKDTVARGSRMGNR